MRSQDLKMRAMPEDPGAELSGKYDFSAKRLEEYLLSAKPQDKIIPKLQEVILYPIWIIQFTFNLFIH
jgi:hypothetical protein